MIHSRDRILTTHVGSLPRNATLTDLLIRREAGETIDPATMASEMDRAVRSIIEQQIGRRHRHRQRRRAAARRLPDLHPRAHVGLQRRIQAQGRQGLPGGAGADRPVPAPLPQAQQDLQRPAGDRRGALPRHQGHQGRDRPLQGLRRAGQARLRRGVHDRAVARHRRHHHDQRPLPQPRSLPDGAGARDAARVSGHPRGRADPADRCARPRHGTHHDVPGPERGRVRQDVRAAHGGHQQEPGRHPARPRAAALLLGQLGGPARARHRRSIGFCRCSTRRTPAR